MVADLRDKGALQEATDKDQGDAQHSEELEVTGCVLPPVEVAAERADQG